MDNPKIDQFGNKRYYVNGARHRTDGPAFEFASGTKSWWLNDCRHRTDGPAVEYADGRTGWYLDGEVFFTFDEWLDENSYLTHEQKVIMKLQYG
jgi:hypothetical protein